MTNEQKIQKLKVFRDNGKVLLDPCLIDKDRLWKEITEIFDMAIEALQLPSAQPKQKKGRWIAIVKGCKLTSYKCSECGRYIADDTGYDVKKDYPFCHCGADMREDADE